MAYTLSKYLVLTPKKYSGLEARIVKSISNASIPGNAVVLKLNISLPDSMFQKPQLQASIVIDENQVTPHKLDAQVIENIKETLKHNLGIDMTISVVDNDEQAS